MSSDLTRELFNQIVDFLLPEMGDREARKALVEAALYRSSVLQKIKWDEAARPFTIQLVRLLLDFGDVSAGKSALVALLEEVRNHVGSDRRDEADQIIAQIMNSHTGRGIPKPADPLPQPEIIKSVSVPVAAPKEMAPIQEPQSLSAQTPTVQTSDQKSAASIINKAYDTPRWPRKIPFQPNILVMKGGGVKGIAYVGALQVLEEHGYHFDHFVGTSAGAISAALLAVGYTPTELGEILEKTDFREFKDGWLPLSILLLLFSKGLYEGEAFRIWMESRLRQKYPQFDSARNILFEHLKQKLDRQTRLTIFASTKDRTAYKFDSEDPEEKKTKISFACRCSMAIPYFFKPVKIKDQWVVDGGMQNNYPIDALLKYLPSLKDTSNFIGLYLGTKEINKGSKWLLSDLLSIWSEAGDEEAKEEFFDRTIFIDPYPVKTTDFSLSGNEVKFLLAEGRAAALHWLNYRSDETGKVEREFQAARAESDKLRAEVVSNRRYRLWKKILIYFLIVVAGSVAIWLLRLFW